MEFEIVKDRRNLIALREAWNSLASSMKEGAVFHSLEWFEAWYGAYCPKGYERIIVVRDREKIRAILPGMAKEKKVRGISFKVFSYAGNGHSPRCGVLAAPGDIEAIEAAITGAADPSLGLSVDFSVYPLVMSQADTCLAVKSIQENTDIHIEHSFESPTCDLSSGWDSYINSRSSSLRKNHRKDMKRLLEMMGEPRLEIISSDAQVDGIIQRLAIIDQKTWQYRNGTGLFSTSENSALYRQLIKKFIPTGEMTLAFLVAGNTDIAFDVVLGRLDVRYTCKVGYDPAYMKCGPGTLLTYLLIKHYSEIGIKEFDLIGEKTPEKMNWATHCQEHSNFWIFNGRSIKGTLLYNALKLRGIISGPAGKL